MHILESIRVLESIRKKEEQKDVKMHFYKLTITFAFTISFAITMMSVQLLFAHVSK